MSDIDNPNKCDPGIYQIVVEVADDNYIKVLSRRIIKQLRLNMGDKIQLVGTGKDNMRGVE